MTRFKPGASGNPKGRKPGTTTRAGKLRDAIAKDLPEIIATLTGLAKSGDVQAARLLLDRCLPALRPQDQAVNLPLGADLADAGRAVLAAVGSGALTPDQAGALASVFAALVRVREATELEQRITKLEESANDKP